MLVRGKRRAALVALVLFLTLLVALVIANAVPDGYGLQQRITPTAAVDSAQFSRDAEGLLGTEVTAGNSVQDLQNGDAFFPAMLTDIYRARRSIELESYILRKGAIADVFVAALANRAAAGVEVSVVVDWLGSRVNDEDVRKLRAAGVHVVFFRPLTLSNLLRMNFRTHRKLLIVDGKVAYTGGMGIDDAWLGNADNGRRKREMMFRLQGPVVRQLHAVFQDHWIALRGQALVGPAYTPELPDRGAVLVQSFDDEAGTGKHVSRRMFLLAIDSARSSIDLDASYFVPDDLLSKALLAALARGVRVRIVVEGDHVDGHLVSDASRAHWGPFLAAGAQIYRFGPSLFHSKLMIVDRYLTIAGSGNFDNRSFRLNAESNVNIYDRVFAGHMTEVFERDLPVSHEVTLREWQSRPRAQRVTDWAAALLAPQL